MTYSVRNIARRFSSLISFSKTKTMNFGKCYFRYIESEEKVDISLLFKVKESMKQFNFNRKATDNLQTVLNRIAVNIQKAYNKGNKKKGASGGEDMDVEIKIYDEKNNLISEQLTCLELFSLGSPVKMKIIDSVYEAVFNVPWVDSLKLPQTILAGFPVYPQNCTIHYADKRKSTFNWYTAAVTNEKGNPVAEAHIKWELVSNNYVYVPSTKDIGLKLKLECIPGNGKEVGPAVECVSKNVIEAGPGHCPFETRHMFTTTKLSGKSFRCVTYNILADLYCDSNYTRTVLHPYCPPYALDIGYRKQLIIKELVGYNADLICLQEVDTKIFNDCLSPILEDEGLDGVFYKKGKQVAEGLACFYRRDRFSLLGQKKIVLSDVLKTESCFKPIWDGVKDNEPLLERLLDRSTIASATSLQSIDNPNEILLVGNTHLYFHPDADHIRLIQGGMFIYWIQEMKKQLEKESPGKRVSVVLCGDYNSVPSCGIYQLYTTGVAPKTLPDWESNANEAVKNLELKQEIPLQSACGTPPFTNFTDGFADCLDYIFYDTSKLQVEQVIPLPSEEELRAHTALPSIVFPSDHVSLVSDLRFI